MTKSEFQMGRDIQHLFNRMKEMYPETLEGLKLQVSNSTMFGSGIDPENKKILIDISQIINSKNSNSVQVQIEIKELKKANPNITFHEFVLLHEIGHYLDFMDNNIEFLEKRIEHSRMMVHVLNSNTSDEMKQYMYSHTPKERAATLYAYRMAKYL